MRVPDTGKYVLKKIALLRDQKIKKTKITIVASSYSPGKQVPITSLLFGFSHHGPYFELFVNRAKSIYLETKEQQKNIPCTGVLNTIDKTLLILKSLLIFVDIFYYSNGNHVKIIGDMRKFLF